MENWKRDYWFDETGLAWINPSPNMRNLNQAALYPGIGAIEYANISVGRGTDQPFEQIGAPWIDGPRLAAGELQPRESFDDIAKGLFEAAQRDGEWLPERLGGGHLFGSG